jgi:fructose-1-phosphate kinase PfkB-like protein
MRFTRAESLKGAVKALLDQGAGAVIVHSGSRGSSGHTPTETVEAPAVPVPTPRSQTGSGDVFTAAFLLHDALSLEERLMKSNECAARHLMGTPSYIPTLDEDLPPAP